MEVVVTANIDNEDQMDKEATLYKYFRIPEEIEQLEVERMNFSRNYYSEHSFYSHTVYDGYDIHNEAPRVETVAINLADAQKALHDHIKRKRRVYRQFMEWVASLSADKRFHLEAKYIDYELLSYWSVEDAAYEKALELENKSCYITFN